MKGIEVDEMSDAELIAALLAELKEMRNRFVRCVRHQGTEEEFARAAVAGADQLIAQAEAHK